MTNDGAHQVWHQITTTTTTTTATTVVVLLFTVALIAVVQWLMTSDRPSPTSSTQPLRVGVFGAGAIGSVCGLRMLSSEIVERVVLVGRDSLRKALCMSNGRITLVFYPKRGSTKQQEQVVETFDVDKRNDLTVCYSDEDVSELKSCQVILIAVKTLATERVAQDLAAALPLDSTATVISFQNGINNAELLKPHFAKHKDVAILTGVVGFPAEWELTDDSSCRFHQTSHGRCLVEYPSSAAGAAAVHRERVTTLVRALNDGGLRSAYTNNINALKHVKLLLNLINPISALSGMPVVEMLSHRQLRQVWAEAIREGSAAFRETSTAPGVLVLVVGTLLPVLLVHLPEWVLWLLLTRRLGENYTSSMFQDFQRGRKTEIDDFCGEIVRLANEASVPTPVNAALVRLIRKHEASGRVGSPCISPQDLLEQVGLLAGSPNVGTK